MNYEQKLRDDIKRVFSNLMPARDINVLFVIVENKTITGGKMEELRNEINSLCNGIECADKKDIPDLLNKFNHLNPKVKTIFEESLQASDDNRITLISEFNELYLKISGARVDLLDKVTEEFEFKGNVHCDECMEKEGIIVLQYSKECPVCKKRNMPAGKDAPF